MTQRCRLDHRRPSGRGTIIVGSRQLALGCTLVLAGVMAAAGCSTAGSPIQSPPPSSASAHAGVAGLVDIGAGRRLYVECRGSGSPTVVLISTGNASSDEWKQVADVAQQKLVTSAEAVFPTMARQTRTCVYDRPGTRRADGRPSPSTRVPQPTTAQQALESLRAGLAAAGERPPYVVAGGSWGGMIAQAFTRSRPDEVHGQVLIDSASGFLPTTLTAAQWQAFLDFADSLDPQQYEVPDYPASIAALAREPVATVPTAVLSSERPWQLVPTLPATQTFPRWTAAQRDLAAELRATHVTDTASGHLIAVEQPQKVIAALTTIVDQAR